MHKDTGEIYSPKEGKMRLLELVKRIKESYIPETMKNTIFKKLISLTKV